MTPGAVAFLGGKDEGRGRPRPGLSTKSRRNHMPATTTPTLDDVMFALMSAFEMADIYAQPMGTSTIKLDGGKILVQPDDGEVTLHLHNDEGWVTSSVTFRNASLSLIEHTATGIACDLRTD
jgi:hypothetical protein